MPEKWTNRSFPPSSGVMKPKPFSSLNHLTVPVGILVRYLRGSCELRTRRPFMLHAALNTAVP